MILYPVVGITTCGMGSQAATSVSSSGKWFSITEVRDAQNECRFWCQFRRTPSIFSKVMTYFSVNYGAGKVSFVTYVFSTLLEHGHFSTLAPGFSVEFTELEPNTQT